MRIKNQRSKSQRGQGMIEYVALTALVAIVCIGTVKVFGNKVRSRLHQIVNTFDRNIQQGFKSRPGDSEPDSNESDGSRSPGSIRLPRSIRIAFPK